jgi:nicotinate phosphoribosyltransferase
MSSAVFNHYPHLALATDFYQITMAYGYFKAGMADHEACFQLYFRNAPFKGSYAVACGLQNAIEYIENFKLSPNELDYLGQLKDPQGKLMFDEEFLVYLHKLKFSCDVAALPEGTLVFGNEPLLQIKGPILQCQLLETSLLNLINFQTLIATKAARIRSAAGSDEIIDFGLRRAQGLDGGISASRAAFIGGCDGTSNVFAAKQYGIPVRGTLGHSWIMAFDDERLAFDTYAEHMPNNCVLLVDTYNSIEGIQNAIATGHALRKQKHDLLGIRLDSGDFSALSKTARQMLDDAGFENAKIVVSGDLDEYRITDLKAQGTPIDTWGVGTRLVTAFDEPALGGIYKLAAVRKPGEDWRHVVKISEDEAKATTPGIFQIRRYSKNSQFLEDLLFEPGLNLESEPSEEFEDLLVPIFDKGRCIYNLPSIEQIKSRAASQLTRLDGRFKVLKNPAQYSIRLHPVLASRRQRLMQRA